MTGHKRVLGQVRWPGHFAAEEPQPATSSSKARENVNDNWSRADWPFKEDSHSEATMSVSPPPFLSPAFLLHVRDSEACLHKCVAHAHTHTHHPSLSLTTEKDSRSAITELRSPSILSKSSSTPPLAFCKMAWRWLAS